MNLTEKIEKILSVYFKTFWDFFIKLIPKHREKKDCIVRKNIAKIENCK